METHILKGRIFDKKTKEEISNTYFWVKQNGEYSPKRSPVSLNERECFEKIINPKGKKSIQITCAGYKTQNFRFYTNGKTQDFYLEPLAEEKTKSPEVEKPTETKRQAMETQAQPIPALNIEKEKQAKTLEEIAEMEENQSAKPPRGKAKPDWEQRIMIIVLIILFGAIVYFIWQMTKKPSTSIANLNSITPVPPAVKTEFAAPVATPSAPNSTPQIIKR